MSSVCACAVCAARAWQHAGATKGRDALAVGGAQQRPDPLVAPVTTTLCGATPRRPYTRPSHYSHSAKGGGERGMLLIVSHTGLQLLPRGFNQIIGDEQCLHLHRPTKAKRDRAQKDQPAPAVISSRRGGGVKLRSRSIAQQSRGSACCSVICTWSRSWLLASARRCAWVCVCVCVCATRVCARAR